MEEVLGSLHWSGFSWVYTHLVGNPVAAFPSMHAAYPTLVFLFLWERWKVAALVWLPVTLIIWFAIVYLGHHYVVDVLGGIAYAVVGYLLLRHSTFGSRIFRAYGRAFSRAARDAGQLLRLRGDGFDLSASIRMTPTQDDATKRRLAVPWRAIAAITVLGALIRLIPVLGADFPLNDGGLFAEMILAIRANGFALPAETHYNAIDLPFAYPPLGLYVAARCPDPRRRFLPRSDSCRSP